MNGPAAIVILAALAFTGCAINAAGPSLSAVAHAPTSDGAAIYVFRDKARYAAQAAHVVRPVVTVDNRPVGNLANGGFLEIDVPAGRHALSIGEPGDTTLLVVDTPAGSSAYIEVWDKTRMQGARLAAGAVAFGLVRGAVGDAIAGAAIGGSQGVTADGEGRTWLAEWVPPDRALITLAALSRSD